MMLVGNKTDLGHLREVLTSDGVSFAQNRGISFTEISALNGEGVESAFLKIVEGAHFFSLVNVIPN